MATTVDVPSTPDTAYAPAQPPPSIIRDAILEFSGTMLFVYISIAGVNQAILTSQSQLHIPICFAVGLSSGILVAGKSGGHLNPAVSLVAYVTDEGFHAPRLLAYVCAQMLGGFLAGVLVVCVYYSWINSLTNDDAFAGAFGTLREYDNSLFSTILDQFIGSTLLMFSISAIPDSNTKPLLVGTTLGALGLFQGSNGFAFNMARDLGPRVASTIILSSLPFTAESHWFWVPIVIPFFGVFFGLLLARAVAMPHHK